MLPLDALLFDPKIKAQQILNVKRQLLFADCLKADGKKTINHQIRCINKSIIKSYLF